MERARPRAQRAVLALAPRPAARARTLRNLLGIRPLAPEDAPAREVGQRDPAVDARAQCAGAGGVDRERGDAERVGADVLRRYGRADGVPRAGAAA